MIAFAALSRFKVEYTSCIVDFKIIILTHANLGLFEAKVVEHTSCKLRTQSPNVAIS